MSDEPLIVQPGYAIDRLRRALAAAASHADPEVRRRAAGRVEQWQAVLAGMADGTLTIGGRTPVAGTPAWVTLEVAHGGFATGRLLAEGPLAEHEEALLREIERVAPGATPRARLNGWYLGDAGQAALVAAVREGRVTVALPEEGALPVVAWLLAAGQDVAALDLVDTLQPWFARLRFYPRLVATPRPSGSVVHVDSAGAVAAELRAARPRPAIAAMHEALRVWNPLFDRLVALWLETVDGEAPRYEGEGAARTIVGGWPGHRWPAGWAARRDAWLADVRAAAATATRCRKHADRKSLFHRLCVVLERCPGGPMRAGDESRVRHALAGTISRRGAPDSPALTRLRAEQAAVAAAPSNVELAGVLARRLAAYPAGGGLPALEPIAGPIAEGECTGVAAGTAMPEHLVAKASRALEAPIAELVERGIVGSAEVLAIVLPQITSHIAAAGLDDPGLRDLYGQTYAAFRRRRSLLLLDLERQVRFEELPWIAALAPLRRDGLDTRAQARQTLEEVVILALTGFPGTIVPNPLVREMHALAGRAGLKLALVEEIAADIFMGTFTAKWAEAATVAAEALTGTVYADYYDLPPARTYLPQDDDGAIRRVMARVVRGRWARPVAETFAATCDRRASEAGSGGGSRVAVHGAILEQSQILTTHNLAGLVVGLELGARLRVLAPSLAARAFAEVVRRQAQSPPDFRAQLQAVKNAAYAWRQAIFFLAFCDAAAQRRVVDELAANVAAATDRGWAERFAPAVAGLRHVLAGGRFDAEGRAPQARRFLGWSIGKHWLFA